VRTWPNFRRVIVALIAVQVLLLLVLVGGIAILHMLEPSNATPP
jgi:hypothetical protein